MNVSNVVTKYGNIVEIFSFAIFKIHMHYRIRIAEIAWKYSGSEFETTHLSFQNKIEVSTIYNSQYISTYSVQYIIYTVYTINMYAVYSKYLPKLTL